MKIYTKKGDTGTTSLYDGSKVTKNNIIIHSVGELDELNSELGSVLAHLDINKLNESDIKYFNLLNNIQSQLFDLGSIMANNPNSNNIKNKGLLFDKNSEFISIIENYIDEMTNKLPQLKNFILPGGNVLISTIHRARTVCRRTERSITLIKYEPLYFNEDTDIISIENMNRCLAYINRLSDYLFTLARFTAHICDIPEIIYIKTKIIE
jgi:cob(I)alamin adenosyltransferase